MRNLRQLLSFLAGELAQAHGERFFAQLCEAIGVYLHVRGVAIAEWVGSGPDRQARTLAFWHDGQQLEQACYAITGTPCAEIRPGSLRVYGKDVGKLFPDSAGVSRFKIESYAGVAFADASGKIVGHMCLFDTEPREFSANELDSFHIASIRAGAEINRLAAERTLEENENRYRAIVNKTGEAILVWRGDEVIDCNDTALRMFACEREELLGKGALALAPALQGDGTPSVQRLEELKNAMADEAGPFTWRHQRLDGECFDAEMSIENIVIAGQAHLVTLSRDISRRLRASEALMRSERALRATLEHSPVAMMVCGASGEIEMVNREFETLFGYALEDIPTLDRWWPLAFPDVEVAREIKCKWYDHCLEALAGRSGVNPIETDVACRDGSSRFVQINCVQVGEKQLATLLDLTAQKHALELAQQARCSAESSSQAKDQFLAALSHELRTPLTPVLLAASHLNSMSDLPEELRSLVEVIRRNAEMEARLIDDLLDLARVANGKLQITLMPTNVHNAILATLQICWSDILARKLHIVQELDAHDCFTLGDAARLQQVFWNLLKNAVKFTCIHGKILLRTSNRPSSIAGAPADLVIEVIDSGMGMTPETLSKLFTAFQQGSREIARQFGGLGLGLSITKSIVALHGGRIEASSDGPGSGSSFVVTLRTCPAPSTTEVAPVLVAAGPDQKARILLVEDHQPTGQLLKRILERFGHDVMWAQSCNQAQELIGAVDGFDLLLSDLGLPDGSGLEIMPIFHRRTGRPGIALSGFGMDQDISRTREAGFAMHLIKPIDVHRLHDAVSSLVSAGIESAGELAASGGYEPAYTE